MRKKLSMGLMILGVILILAAAGLAGYNAWESQQAGERSAAVLSQMEDAIWEEPQKQKEEVPETLAPVPEMPVVVIDGQEYVGKLSIPALELELPVINEWNYDRLQTAPCRYNGSVYTNNMVLCGHSYARHFGYLPRLKAGDPVIFTLMDDTVFQFEVAEVEILRPTDVDAMVESEYPLSLFTCTKDSQSRVTVRCTAVR